MVLVDGHIVNVNENRCAYCPRARHESDGSHYCPVDWDSLEYSPAEYARVSSVCQRATKARDANVVRASGIFRETGHFFQSDDDIWPVDEDERDFCVACGAEASYTEDGESLCAACFHKWDEDYEEPEDTPCLERPETYYSERD